MVPQAVGGATDVFARHLAQKLTLAWSQPVVVENRVGAAGVCRYQDGARALQGHRSSHDRCDWGASRYSFCRRAFSLATHQGRQAAGHWRIQRQAQQQYARRDYDR